MKRIVCGLGLAAAMGVFVVGCGGPEKPPLMPDGPLETMPAGSDGGDIPAAPATPSTSAASATPTPTSPSNGKK